MVPPCGGHQREACRRRNKRSATNINALGGDAAHDGGGSSAIGADGGGGSSGAVRTPARYGKRSSSMTLNGAAPITSAATSPGASATVARKSEPSRTSGVVRVSLTTRAPSL